MAIADTQLFDISTSKATDILRDKGYLILFQLRIFTWMAKNQVYILTMFCIPIIHYFKVFLENIYVTKLNQFVLPMDV